MDANEDRRNGRRLYFKALRKRQKSKRKERKREEERRAREKLRRERYQALVQNIRRNIIAGQEPRISEAKGVCLEDEDAVPEKNSVEKVVKGVATQNQAKNDSGALVNRNQDALPEASQPVMAETRSQFKEIDQRNIVLAGKTVGAGTFGTCRLATYRNVHVVLKEFKSYGESQGAVEKHKREVLHEAKIITCLGDHPGLPLLFGVQTKIIPYSLVLQFHGHKDTSLTIYKASYKKKLSNDEWKGVIGLVGEALNYIHTKGYLHNDLKANNVLLEKKHAIYNPIIIDFGKSGKIGVPRRKNTMTKTQQKEYRQLYPHIAPEVASGKDCTISSDVYSLAKMIDFISVKTRANLCAEIVLWKNLALSDNAEQRPQLSALISK